MPRAAYVYCVVRNDRKPATARVPAGVPDAGRPDVVEIGRAQWLVVSEVPLEAYGPERLDTALRDLDWVSRVAVSHEAVVEHFARQRRATVLPMKLFTMFTTVERAAAEMGARRRDLARIFRRVAGCEEWGVRVTRGAARRATPLPSSASSSPSGVAFLTARKRALDEAKQAGVRAAEMAEAAFESLAPLARDVRRRRDAPAGALPPLLDAAFLVPRARRATFQVAARAAAKVCANAGAEMTVTGPWPAYNFVETGADR
jgi:hypothetical protein